MVSRLHADILIVTATKAETLAVLDVFGANDTPRSIDGRVYFSLGTVNGASLRLTQCEMGAGGLGGSLQAISKGLSAFSPLAVIMAGVAFGANADYQSIGDVLVAERLRPYDLQRVGTAPDGAEKIIARDDRPHVSPWLLNLFRSSEITWKGAQVRFGVILTGTKLVDNVDFRDQLRDIEPEAIGGEMEGAGLYVACHDQKTDWILVKAICDFADGRKALDKEAHQAHAATSAAQFICHALNFVHVDWSTMRRHAAIDARRGELESRALADLSSTEENTCELTLSQELALSELNAFSRSHIEWRLTKENGDRFLTSGIADIVQPFRHSVRHSLILLDINGLNQVNDKFGLQVGDAAIRRVAEYLMTLAPCSARCGDDTFFVLLRDMDSRSALTFAASISDGILKFDWNSVMNGLYISCAFGVAELRAEEPLQDWTARAAIGMKRAKSTRGNIQAAPEFLSPTEPRDLHFHYS